MTQARFPRKTGTVEWRGEPVQIRQLSASEKGEWASLAGNSGDRAARTEAVYVALAYGLDPPMTIDEARQVPEDFPEVFLEPILRLAGVDVDLAKKAPSETAGAEEEAAGPKG